MGDDFDKQDIAAPGRRFRNGIKERAVRQELAHQKKGEDGAFINQPAHRQRAGKKPFPQADAPLMQQIDGDEHSDACQQHDKIQPAGKPQQPVHAEYTHPFNGREHQVSQETDGFAKAAGAEKDISDADEHKNECHLERMMPAAFWLDAQLFPAFFAPAAGQAADHLIGAVQKPPYHIVPGCAVPQAADQEGDQQTGIDRRFGKKPPHHRKPGGPARPDQRLKHVFLQPV